MRKHGTLSLILALLAGCVMANRPAEEETARLGLGQPATAEDIRLWNIDVAPSGEGLPPGRGTVPQGATVYAAKCAKCHGASGTEGPMDRLVGGQTQPGHDRPGKNYWKLLALCNNPLRLHSPRHAL